MTDTQGHLKERVWQFRLTDDATENCAAYFAERASEFASALNCRLVALSGVKVHQRSGDVKVVVGTALLANLRIDSVIVQRADRDQGKSRKLRKGLRQC